jgi:hypothetical protein
MNADGPVWNDGCNHGPECYVGTYMESPKDKGQDVYLYFGSIGVEVCLRYGPNVEEYASPGEVTRFLMSETGTYHYELKEMVRKAYLKRFAPRGPRKTVDQEEPAMDFDNLSIGLMTAQDLENLADKFSEYAMIQFGWAKDPEAQPSKLYRYTAKKRGLKAGLVAEALRNFASWRAR